MANKLFHKIIAFIWSGYVFYRIGIFLAYYQRYDTESPTLFTITKLIFFIIIAVLLLKHIYRPFQLNAKIKTVIILVFAIATIEVLSYWVGFHYLSLQIGKLFVHLRSASLIAGTTPDFEGIYPKFFRPTTIEALKDFLISIPFVLTFYSLAVSFYGEDTANKYLPPKRSTLFIIIPVFMLVKCFTHAVILFSSPIPFKFLSMNLILLDLRFYAVVIILLVAALGLLRARNWARILAVVVCIERIYFYFETGYKAIISAHQVNIPEVMLITRSTEMSLNILAWLFIAIYLILPKVKNN